MLGLVWATSLLLVAALPAADFAKPPLGLDAYLPTPADNPLTPERVALGRDLFFEKRLSRDGSVSCATCHDPQLAYTDKEPVAVGVDGQKGTRRTPRLINRAYGKSFFWDGRAATLEEQVLKPIANPIEMDLAVEDAVALLSADADYAAKFEAAFLGEPSAERLSFALAAYVRTILSGDSPYDRYLAGDEAALTPDQKRGLDLFRGKAACAVCHVGPNLTDERFHNTGVGWAEGELADEGRAAVTGNSKDRGAFKTPPLRGGRPHWPLHARRQSHHPRRRDRFLRRRRQREPQPRLRHAAVEPDRRRESRPRSLPPGARRDGSRGALGGRDCGHDPQNKRFTFDRMIFSLAYTSVD